jgi:hypothetical protein
VQIPLENNAPAPLTTRARVKALAIAAWAAVRAAILLVILVGSFIVATSATAAPATPAALRILAGLALVLGLPLLLRQILRRRARARNRRVPRLGGWFIAGWNLALAAVLCGCLSSFTGRALVQQGDWVLGETDGWFPRRYRPAVRSFGEWLSRLEEQHTSSKPAPPRG